MEYGCIGEKLSHSFSKEIHKSIADYEYELCELTPQQVEQFMVERKFKAINVTIPYKQTVIPYLDEIDDTAREIGAVNTVVNRNGRLYGYNTDFAGMSELLRFGGIELKDKKVLILGSGGTSKTALAVARRMGAKDIFRVTRGGKDGCITYEQMYEWHTDAQIIINTTPVGMFPNINGAAVDINRFAALCGVVDAVYNPLRSMLVQKARERGVSAVGGLYMLVMQAACAVQHFTGNEISEQTVMKVFREIYSSKRNLVLIGMPSSGKTTIGRQIAERLGMNFFDSDEEIVKQSGHEISEIFSLHGEQYFRELESGVLERLSKGQSSVISTGGGAILREDNLRFMRANGTLIFIDRPLGSLIATNDRPLSNDREKLERLYRERYEKYIKAADITVDCNDDIKENVSKIIEEFENENFGY